MRYRIIAAAAGILIAINLLLCIFPFKKFSSFKARPVSSVYYDEKGRPVSVTRPEKVFDKDGNPVTETLPDEELEIVYTSTSADIAVE